MRVMLINPEEQDELRGIEFLRKCQRAGIKTVVTFDSNKWISIEAPEVPTATPPERTFALAVNQFKQDIHDAGKEELIKGEQFDVREKPKTIEVESIVVQVVNDLSMLQVHLPGGTIYALAIPSRSYSPASYDTFPDGKVVVTPEVIAKYLAEGERDAKD